MRQPGGCFWLPVQVCCHCSSPHSSGHPSPALELHGGQMGSPPAGSVGSAWYWIRAELRMGKDSVAASTRGSWAVGVLLVPEGCGGQPSLQSVPVRRLPRFAGVLLTLRGVSHHLNQRGVWCVGLRCLGLSHVPLSFGWEMRVSNGNRVVVSPSHPAAGSLGLQSPQRCLDVAELFSPDSSYPPQMSFGRS